MKAKERIPGLLDEDFISVYPTLAVRAGINKAAILQKLHYLVRITENANNEANFIAGRWWVYNTYEAWQTNYFPWLSITTLKRLFLELEEEQIVLTYTPPGNSRKKYYTINREFWATWLTQTSSQNETQKHRAKKRRTSSQNETNIGSKESDTSSQNDTTIVPKRDDASIYMDSEKTQNRLSEPTQIPPTSSAPIGDPPSAAASEPAAGDDDCQFILPEVRHLGLNQEVQERLVALGAPIALAIAFAAQGPGVHNPAGLAVTMLHNGGPPELDLERAKIALELRTLDRAAIDDHLRRREYAQLTDEAQDLVTIKAGQEELPGEGPPSSAPPASPAGLDTILDGGSLTMRDIWQAARRALKLQLNRETYDLWVRDVQPVRYADGVLTVEARCSTAREALLKHDWLGPAVTHLAGRSVRVEVISFEEARR